MLPSVVDNAMKSPWEGKSVLITGACGTVGRELLKQILDIPDVKEIVCIDNNESDLFFLEEAYRGESRCHFYFCDIREINAVRSRMAGINIVLHTAALKHVHLCEKSPDDAIATNIRGLQNIIKAAQIQGVERVLFTSSDKAVNPTNVMGTSKLMGERLMTAAAESVRGGGTVFVSTRFGNVLGSRGSVIPLFRKQIEAGGPLTLTDPNMTRFIMTLREAVMLVIESVFLAKGGEVFVTKMPVVRIEDLATVMVNRLADKYGHEPKSFPIESIGPRPGEKLYEELVNSEEIRRTIELPRYYVVLPAFKPRFEAVTYEYPGMKVIEKDAPYDSSVVETMSVDSLDDFLVSNSLLE